MRRRACGTLTVLLGAALAAGLVGTARQQLDYRQGAADYAEAARVAAVPEKEPIPKETEKAEDPIAAALAETDLAALQAVNGEVVGWISIPGTEINYPLLQGKDNQYYLDHTWNGEGSSVGAIFLDCRSAPDFSDGNTILYGHNMRDGSMFGALRDYRDDSYWEAHPSVYVVNEGGVRRYDIYAVYEANVKAITYTLQFDNEAGKEAFLQYGLDSSMVSTGVVPAAEDPILTLSTCTGVGYSSRWVVQAALTG